MDWAMKFLQMKYREKQSDWFGKRGLSWHVSTVISKHDEDDTVEVETYAHIFDCCQQDWFAVCSIFENLIENVVSSKPSVNCVFIRSDEAGCYHNNAMIASLKDVGKRLGIEVKSYDYSEPAYGKDVCDRILCPMKTSIRSYCNEGHDIATASDMRTALLERPVRGVTASVCAIDEKKKSLEFNNIDGYSKLHNFTYEKEGIRVRRAYGIGSGKELPYDDIVINHQGPTEIAVQDNHDFFAITSARQMNVKKSDSAISGDSTDECQLFECPEPGCQRILKSFRELEIHIEIGDHGKKPMNESIYDRLRREWAARFSTVDKDS